jgi:hypothetical protein
MSELSTNSLQMASAATGSHIIHVHSVATPMAIVSSTPHPLVAIMHLGRDYQCSTQLRVPIVCIVNLYLHFSLTIMHVAPLALLDASTLMASMGIDALGKPKPAQNLPQDWIRPSRL